MLFQYGRYLTIESSRETPEDDPYRETLPSNLLGYLGWCEQLRNGMLTTT